MMMLACAVPAFAEDGHDDTPSVVRIPEGTKVVTSSTLDDGIIDRLRVKTIYVPSSVTTIKEGALTGYANVTNVYVENSKDNITIENGALPTGTNIVYTEKPTPPPSTTTTTKKSEESTTKKDEESTTKKDEESTTKKTTTTKKGETTKKTTKKTTKRTVSSSATTSNPKDRTTVQHRPLTIPSTKATKKTTVKGPLIPEVEVDPEEIEEQPDPTMEAETTTVTFAGEAITDKDGTIIGFEDPQTSRSETDRSARRAKIITGIAVGVVGLTSAAFAFLKLRKRP